MLHLCVCSIFVLLCISACFCSTLAFHHAIPPLFTDVVLSYQLLSNVQIIIFYHISVPLHLKCLQFSVDL